MFQFYRFVVMHGRSEGQAFVEDGHVGKVIVNEFLHQIAGFYSPRAVFNQGNGTILYVEGLHVFEEVQHNRIDAQVIRYRSQYQVRELKGLGNQFRNVS